MGDWHFQEGSRDSSEPPASPGQRPRKRPSWGWILAATGTLILLVVAVAIVIVITMMGRRAGEVLHLAMQKIREDPAVVARLGEPIQVASWFPTGSVHESGDRGEANLTFSIRGPKEKGTVQVVARRIAGKWGLTSLEVTFSDNRRHTVDVAGEGDGELEAPRWQAGKATAGENTDTSEPPAQSTAPAPPDVTIPAPSVEIKVPETITR